MLSHRPTQDIDDLHHRLLLRIFEGDLKATLLLMQCMYASFDEAQVTERMKQLIPFADVCKEFLISCVLITITHSMPPASYPESKELIAKLAAKALSHCDITINTSKNYLPTISEKDYQAIEAMQDFLDLSEEAKRQLLIFAFLQDSLHITSIQSRLLKKIGCDSSDIGIARQFVLNMFEKLDFNDKPALMLIGSADTLLPPHALVDFVIFFSYSSPVQGKTNAHISLTQLKNRLLTLYVTENNTSGLPRLSTSSLNALLRFSSQKIFFLRPMQADSNTLPPLLFSQSISAFKFYYHLYDLLQKEDKKSRTIAHKIYTSFSSRAQQNIAVNSAIFLGLECIRPVHVVSLLSFSDTVIHHASQIAEKFGSTRLVMQIKALSNKRDWLTHTFAILKELDVNNNIFTPTDKELCMLNHRTWHYFKKRHLENFLEKVEQPLLSKLSARGDITRPLSKTSWHVRELLHYSNKDSVYARARKTKQYYAKIINDELNYLIQQYLIPIQNQSEVMTSTRLSNETRKKILWYILLSSVSTTALTWLFTFMQLFACDSKRDVGRNYACYDEYFHPLNCDNAFDGTRDIVYTRITSPACFFKTDSSYIGWSKHPSGIQNEWYYSKFTPNDVTDIATNLLFAPALFMLISSIILAISYIAECYKFKPKQVALRSNKEARLFATRAMGFNREYEDLIALLVTLVPTLDLSLRDDRILHTGPIHDFTKQQYREALQRIRHFESSFKLIQDELDKRPLLSWLSVHPDKTALMKLNVCQPKRDTRISMREVTSETESEEEVRMPLLTKGKSR